MSTVWKANLGGPVEWTQSPISITGAEAKPRFFQTLFRWPRKTKTVFSRGRDVYNAWVDWSKSHDQGYSQANRSNLWLFLTMRSSNRLFISHLSPWPFLIDYGSMFPAGCMSGQPPGEHLIAAFYGDFCGSSGLPPHSSGDLFPLL